jgi:hypothetical protein
MVVNLILIPRIGFLAACWASLLSDFCHYWICIALLRKMHISVHAFKLMGVPVLGGGLSAICLFANRWSSSIIQTIFCVILAVLVYIGVVIFFKYIKKEDIVSLLHHEKRSVEMQE